MEILKKKLTDKKGRWAKEMPRVLWAYQTTIRTSMGETSFALTYDSEAVMPIDVGMPSYLVQHFNPNNSDKRLESS